ncbi:hypothetical protein HX867_32035 [Pseudomonas gingeri]|nr:hypothetical protein [Pseudomonas gingeri]NVZ75427.1 hypothetical protein [Pseudomonas gingeri]NWA11202.1 hypothetical protein [Pseudomonas gingeri]
MLMVPVVVVEAVITQPGDGRFLKLGSAHRPPPAVVLKEVIVATPPETVPLAVTGQVTGAWNDEGDFTVIEPVALNEPSELLLTIVAAFAMDAAPKQTAMAVADTRVLMPFIVVFPHMYGDSFRRG